MLFQYLVLTQRQDLLERGRQRPRRRQRFRPRSSSDPGHEDVPAIVMGRRRDRLQAEDDGSTDVDSPNPWESHRSSSLPDIDRADGPRQDRNLPRRISGGTTDIGDWISYRELGNQIQVPAVYSSATYPGPLPAVVASTLYSSVQTTDNTRMEIALPFRESSPATWQTLGSFASEDIENQDPSERHRESSLASSNANASDGSPGTPRAIAAASMGDATVLIRLPELHSFRANPSHRVSRGGFLITPIAPSGRGGALHHAVTHIPRRRRLNAEQENEDNWDEFEEERVLWLARQQGGADGGTPPGQRWYEQYLRD